MADTEPRTDAAVGETGAKWYVVHTYSGYENKVKSNIEMARKNRHMENRILEVFIPEEEETEIKESDNGAVKTVTRKTKTMPGYVFVKMVKDSDTWYVVRNTRGVTGFVGPEGDPTPLSDDEVKAFLSTRSPEFTVGDLVTVIAGPFKDSVGVISAVNEAERRVTINTVLNNNEFPVDLDFEEVRKQ